MTQLTVSQCEMLWPLQLLCDMCNATSCNSVQNEMNTYTNSYTLTNIN